jgi:hypothetical protein
MEPEQLYALVRGPLAKVALKRVKALVFLIKSKNAPITLPVK